MLFTSTTDAQNKSKKNTSVVNKKKTKPIKKKTINKNKKKKNLQSRTKPQIKRTTNSKLPLDKIDNLILQLNKTGNDLKPNNTDSLPEKVVTIISAFKPQLKNAAKINISNANAINDTSNLIFSYQVPSQNLSFQYRPISLIPRSYNKIQSMELKNSNSIKVGYGNYFQHYIGADLNIINPTNSHLINVNNSSVAGMHPLQRFQRTELNYISNYTLNKHTHLYTQLYFQNNKRFRYGLVPDSTLLPKANFEQQYAQLGGLFRIQNKYLMGTNYDINPIIKLEYVNGLSKSNGLLFTINAPIYFKLQNNTRLNFDIEYGINKYSSSLNNIQNTLLVTNPSVEIKKSDLHLIVGFTPVFLNGQFNIFPKIIVEKKLKDTNFRILGGWYRVFNNQSLGDLLTINPWIISPTEFKIFQKNRKHIDLLVHLNRRVNYQISLAYNDSRNFLLFNKKTNLNNVINNGLYYEAIFEHRVKTLEFESKIQYQINDQFSLHNHIKYIQFDFLRDNRKPWGILPFELNSSLFYQPNEKWIFEGSLNYWSGATFQNSDNIAKNLKNVLILNTGFQYRLSNKWSIWTKGENLLDMQYERWGDYPSLGVQFMGGIKYTFRK